MAEPINEKDIYKKINELRELIDLGCGRSV